MALTGAGRGAVVMVGFLKTVFLTSYRPLFVTVLCDRREPACLQPISSLLLGPCVYCV